MTSSDQRPPKKVHAPRKKMHRSGATRPWQENLPLVSEPSEKYLPAIAKIITSFGKYYNGFESIGDEKLPKEGPALIVFYHGLIPLDAWYFGLNYYLKTGRLIRGLGDRWLFKIPGMSQLVRAVGGVEGHPQSALRLLSEGHMVGVSPGGVREAIAGNSNAYKLIWGERKGFARVAIESKVDIYPAFTENVDELYRAPFAEKSFFQNLYEKTRLPLVPIVGLGIAPFPVKIRTWIGDPIAYDPNDTPETLTEKTRLSLQSLINKHQPKGKTVIKAIYERFENGKK